VVATLKHTDYDPFVSRCRSIVTIDPHWPFL
jgi:hypothetical protein